MRCQQRGRSRVPRDDQTLVRLYCQLRPSAVPQPPSVHSSRSGASWSVFFNMCRLLILLHALDNETAGGDAGVNKSMSSSRNPTWLSLLRFAGQRPMDEDKIVASPQILDGGSVEGGAQFPQEELDRAGSELEHEEASEVAYVVIIRHGEKPDSGNGLSKEGKKRALYLANCMSGKRPSVMLPWGAPTYVMASYGHPDKSHRPIDTVTPLAQRLRLPLDTDFYFEDHKGWAQRVQESP